MEKNGFDGQGKWLEIGPLWHLAMGKWNVEIGGNSLEAK